jgi:hypothetical protein
MERKRSDIEKIFEDDGSEEAVIDADDTGMIGSERELFEEEITEALTDEDNEGSEEAAT